MTDVGSVDDRWIWRGSTSTRKPRPPPPSLSSETHGAAQPTVPIYTTTKSLSDSETLPSTSPVSYITHPGAAPGWMWSSELVTTKSLDSLENRGITSPASLPITDPSLTNTTLLQDLTSPSKWLHTQYTRNVEVYDIPHLANRQVIAGEIQAELSHPSSLLLLSILVVSLLVSLVANFVMLFTVMRRSYLRQTVFLLYLNLAASDLLASCLSIPVAIIVIFHGGSEERRVGGTPSMAACLLLNVGVVLMSYVSVGSIVGICTVRWCQFYNFSKTRSQERLIIRFFILFLWTTGMGITAGLVIRQTVGIADVRCTPLHLATILNDTLPFSSSFIIIGLILVALVNHLTIRKLYRTAICPYPRQETPIIRRYLAPCTNSSLQNNATSEQSSLSGYPKIISDDIIDRSPPGQYSSVDENKTISADNRHSSTAQVEKDVATSKEVGGCEKNENCISWDLSTAVPDRFCNASSQPPPLPPLPSEVDGFKEGEEKVPRGVCQMKLESADNPSETDLESEHLYESIEPVDVQEEVIPYAEGNSRKQQVQPLRHRVLLPNTIESTYSISPSVKRHQTILVNKASVLGADHNVNTSAWRIGDAIASKTTYQVTQDSAAIQTIGSVIEGENLPDTMRGAFHANKAPTSSLESSFSIGETPLSPRSWLPFISATQYNSRLGSKPHSHAHQVDQRIAARVDVEDSLSAGYLADLSAPTSRPSTPHHKLGRWQRAERIMALTRARAISRQHVLRDSEDEEPNTPRTVSQATTVRGRSCCHKLPSQQPQGTLSDPLSGNKTNPVHLKCVHTSRCLSALFILTYLPLLLVQILLSVLGGTTMLLVTITYMSCLLAVHPCLYGYQTPLLRHAMHKIGKRTRTSLHSQDGDAHL